MRFLVFFNTEKKSLQIEVKNSEAVDVVLPENPSQFVYFPMLPKLLPKIKKDVQKVLNGFSVTEYTALKTEGISEIREYRTLEMLKIREKVNPLIIERCNQFKQNNIEFFI